MSNRLVGQIIKKMKIADNKKAILFITDSEEIMAWADGDCCSDTWIEHIELPANGFPAKVLAVEDIEMPDLGQPDGYEYLQYYGVKITTDKGHMIIDYRNESNGYYGGKLVWLDDRYVSTENWVEINASA